MSESKNVRKEDLIEGVMSKAGLSRDQANKAVTAVIDVISDGVTQGANVYLRQFGTFTAVQRKAKLVRNISKNESFVLPAKKVIKFKPSNALTAKLDLWNSDNQ